MLFIGLLIAAMVAVFVYTDAEKRGMNAAGWALGVFLLLIIFLPAYFAMRKPLIASPPSVPVVDPKPKGFSEISDEIVKLGELKEKGLITEEEFTRQKNKLLNN